MGLRSNYNNDIYAMYEKEIREKEKLSKELKHIKLSYSVLKNDYDKLSEEIDKKIKSKLEKVTNSLNKEINVLKDKLSDAYNEINRLKSKINNSSNNDDDINYTIDKLINQINKDSSNSGIPTSKEIIKVKTRTNTYNHRIKSNKKNGGQFGHIGDTLTKQKLENKIKENNIDVKEIVHKIKGANNQKDIIKYKIGINVNMYVEKHIFQHTKKSKEILPKEYYSDVTYNEDIKALVVMLGNYYSLGYKKVKEILNDFSNGIINISEGTIDNIYEEFDSKTVDTINNITTNLLNSKYQHTDETTTSENGKDTYYRGYANPYNVLYKYHHNKGDAPIKEDGILTRFYGTIISDHEVGIFKYGISNQDCIIHTGRYCIEGNQNVLETEWQMRLYRFLLKLEREREILSKFGKTSFSIEEIKIIEKEYDDILELGEEQNKAILSTYWKEKEDTLLRRLKKYKSTTLFFVHDFDIPYDNNFMERALRMIKGKTKASGGFRSTKGGERFGNIMSIIKTARLRKMNPLACIKNIYEGKSQFA